MFIHRAIIQNYRCLQTADIFFNDRLNVIVGGNECGKSTLLEALHLALTGQLNSRPIQIELHPYLFNMNVVAEYVNNLKKGVTVQPPTISIELFLAEDAALAKLKGINNSLSADIEYEQHTHRCNQAIADLGDSFFPNEPKTRSRNDTITGHDGVFLVPAVHVQEYVRRFSPQVLRYSIRTDCTPFDAMNFGESKGLTFVSVSQRPRSGLYFDIPR